MGRSGTLHWAWIVLGTCFVNLFINYSVRLGYSLVLPEIIQDLSFSRTAGGSIFNAYFFTYVTLTPFTGYLTDRFGARRVISICAFILGLGVVLMGTITNLWTACFFYALVGIGATGMWTPVITVVQRWFTPTRRGLALGILSTGCGLGFATMGAAFPWIMHHFSWRHSWYFLGSGAFLMVLVNSLLLRSDPESSGYLPWGEKEKDAPGEPGEKTRLSLVALSKVFKQKTFWLIGLSYSSIAYSLYGITTFMVDYAKVQMGIPMEKASLLATIHGFCQVIGVLTILPLSDYLGRKRSLILCNAFITVCLLGILMMGRSWIMLCVLVGVLAVFFGVIFPMYGACAGDYFPKEVMGSVIGAWTPFYGLGAISVHWVSGLLRDNTGHYDYAFIINAGMALVALGLICLVKKNEPRPSAV